MNLPPPVTGETYVDEAATYATEANEVEWHWVRLPLAPGAIFNIDSQQKHIQEVVQWCSDTFGDPKTFTDSIIWMYMNGRFWFKYPNDRTAFLLKWG